MAGLNQNHTGSGSPSGKADQKVSNFIAFFNTIDHFLAVIDTSGQIIEVNKAGLDILEYSIHELKGQSARILFEEDYGDEISEKFEKVKKSGRGSWSYSLKTSKGRLIPADISFHSGTWDSKRSYFVVAKDQSSERLISEAHKVSLRLISHFKAAEPERLFMEGLAETTKLTHAPNVFIGLFDKKKSMLKEVYRLVTCTDLDKGCSCIDLDISFITGIRRLVSRKKPFELYLDENFRWDSNVDVPSGIGLAVPVVAFDDNIYILWLSGQPASYSEQDIKLVSILWRHLFSELRKMKYLDELRESEQEYKNLFESSRDALLLYDINSWTIVLCNQTAVKMFGYTSQKELMDQSPLDISHKYQTDGKRSSELLEQSLVNHGNESIHFDDWLHLRKNGDIFHSETTFKEIYYKGIKTILASVRDISEKLKVESELHQSEERFNLAVREAGLGIFDYNVSESTINFGKGVSDILGTSPGSEKFSFDSWEGIVYPDDISLFRRELNDYINRGEGELRIEYRIRIGSGKNKWVQTIGRVVERNFDGTVLRIIGLFIDIDKTRRLAIEVESTRNFLDTIISNIDAIVFVKDTSGRYLLTNRSFIEKFGLESEDIKGKNDRELNIKSDPGSSLADKIVLHQGVEQTYESELTLGDGKNYNYLVSKRPLKNSEGEIYGLIGHATDITHIKELEKDLRNTVFSLDAAINGTGNGLWDWNPKSDLLVLNDNWFSMLGYTRSVFMKKYDKFCYNTFSDLIHPDDVQKMEEELKKHFQGLNDYYQVEIRMLTSDNTWKWILASGKVWERDADDKPTRMVGIHIDIDNRVRTEEQLKEALLKAEESDRLKSSFLANMSHEIRTPMNGIIGFLDLLENDALDNEMRNEYMSIIRSSSNQLLNIVNDIVDISKIESGQIVIRVTEFDVKELMEDISMQYMPALADKKLYFKIDCPVDGKKLLLRSDQTKLRQILSNLVSNAIKFTDAGGIKISCRKKGAFIEFTVSDTGIGIPADMHQRIFNRFIQADMGLTRMQAGTGLGLSICKAYVEKLGGKIWIDKDKKEGSAFVFTLPLKNDTGLADREMKDEGDIGGEKEKDRIILIVEDEIYNFLFVEQILKNRGLVVHHAADAPTAIEMISNNPSIGLVLMDIRLPGMDGYQATREIKKIRPGLPVIALTAMALSGDRERAIDAGCDYYLKKPVLTDELVGTVDRIFDYQ